MLCFNLPLNQQKWNSNWYRILSKCFQCALMVLVSAGYQSIRTTVLKLFCRLLSFCGYLNGNYFKASTVHCNHGRPTWQTKKSYLSKHLDSNQRTLLSTCSHAFPTHLLLKKGCQKILYIWVYVSGVTVSSSFSKYCCSIL